MQRSRQVQAAAEEEVHDRGRLRGTVDKQKTNMAVDEKANVYVDLPLGIPGLDSRLYLQG